MAKRKRKVTIDRAELKEMLAAWVTENMPGTTLDSFEVHRSGGIELTCVVGVDEQPELPGTKED